MFSALRVYVGYESNWQFLAIENRSLSHKKNLILGTRSRENKESPESSSVKKKVPFEMVTRGRNGITSICKPKKEQ